jgi:hypothetical protein
MRRRTLLLAAGLLAYFFGATVRVYLRSDADRCSFRDAGCRVLAVAQHPREALGHPLLAIDFLVTADAHYSE